MTFTLIPGRRFQLMVFALYALTTNAQNSMTSTANTAALPLTTDSVRKISSQFIFTEGPAADRAGNIYFTDQPRNQIWLYNTKGELSLFMDSTGRANGLYFDPKGNLLACADKDNEIWQINKKKQVKILLKSPAGAAFNGPNDLWVDSKGGIYFTDPYYQRNYWTRKKPDLAFQGLYYLPKGKKTAILLDSTMTKPNGIIASPDGRYLYVADIGAGRTYRYVISGRGQLRDRELFVSKGSDGMTVDEQGNLYLSGKGVTIYDPSGKEIQSINVPSNWVGNVCFGGAGFNLLFITASESIYTLQMNVRGNR